MRGAAGSIGNAPKAHLEPCRLSRAHKQRHFGSEKVVEMGGLVNVTGVGGLKLDMQMMGQSVRTDSSSPYDESEPTIKDEQPTTISLESLLIAQTTQVTE
jgi:hypothetical protein